MSIVTPVGGAISPQPSQQLMSFLQAPTLNTDNGRLIGGVAGTAIVGNVLNSVVPGARIASLGVGMALEAAAINDYIEGQAALRNFLKSAQILI